MNEKKNCKLCGREIKKEKGMNQKAYEYALKQETHISCLRIHDGIMRKHRISSNDFLDAVMDGLFLLFPEIEETKSMKNYNSRVQEAKEEIEEVFPYLKEEEGAKKKEEEEGVAKEVNFEEV